MALAVAALALRLWGIGWSLPNQQHLFSYHPDEGVNLVNGVLENGSPHPHLALGFYNYGSLYFYLWQAAVAINRTYGLVRLPPTGSPGTYSPESIAAMLLVGRLVSAVLGALTVWAVFAAGSRLYGRQAGLVAAGAFALIPAGVVHAHFATVDVPATFLLALALAFGARLLESRRWQHVVVAGLVCGFAAAAKYNCGLVLLAPGAALLLRSRGAEEQGSGGAEDRQTFQFSVFSFQFSLLLGTAAAGFLIACPGVILAPDRFWHDFHYELMKSQQGMGLLFVNTGNGWLYHLTTSLRFGMGVPLLTLSLAGLVLALWRMRRQDLYLLAFILPYYLVIGYAQVRFLRYVIPLFPALSVLAGGLVAQGSKQSAGGRRQEAVGGPRQIAYGLLLTAYCLTGVYTLLLSLALDHLMTMPDARDQAYAYIQRTASQGTSIALATTPWYWTPPFTPELTAPNPAERRRAAESLVQYQLRVPDGPTEPDVRVFGPPRPEFAVVSDLESEDWERLRQRPWEHYKAELRAYRSHVFENLPSILGIDFGKPGYVPNDLLYIYPRVTVYQAAP